MKRLIGSVAASLLLSASIFGIAAPALAGPSDNILPIGISTEPVTLDPATGFTGFDYPILYSIYDRLIDFDPKTLEPRPGLATEWKFTGDDNLTFEITLREGVTFHDGTPLDAEAVKKSLTHFKDAGKIQDLDPVTSIEVLAPNKLSLKLSRPYSVLPAVLSDRAGMIVSPAALEKYGEDFPRNPVGTGPFKMSQWTPGASIDLERFKNYWNPDRIRLDGMSYRFITNPTSLVAALLSGQVDYAFNVDPRNIAPLQANTRLRVANDPTLWVYLLMYNPGMKPLDDPRVRQAVSMSVDRQALSDAVLGKGVGEGATAMLVPPSNWAYSPDLAKTVKYDPARAKELLTEAGYPNGITLKICGTALLGYGSDIMAIEQEQMRPAGITLEPTILAGSACQQAWSGKEEYHIRQGGWSGRPDPFMTYQQIFGERGQYNRAKVAYPGVDDLLNKVLATYTREEQKALYDALNKQWLESLPWAPIFAGSNLTVYGNGLEGEEPNAQGKANPVTLYYKKN